MKYCRKRTMLSIIEWWQRQRQRNMFQNERFNVYIQAEISWNAWWLITTTVHLKTKTNYWKDPTCAGQFRNSCDFFGFHEVHSVHLCHSKLTSFTILTYQGIFSEKSTIESFSFLLFGNLRKHFIYFPEACGAFRLKILLPAEFFLHWKI